MAGQNLTALNFPLLSNIVDLLEGNDRIWEGWMRSAVLHQSKAGKEYGQSMVSATCKMQCRKSTSVVVFIYVM